jgi:D-methionine transport system substrate-binding protein
MNASRCVLFVAALLAVLGVNAPPRTLRLGVTSGPHAQIAEEVAKVASRRGVLVKVVEFSDDVQPNAALADGSLDANSFQHRPYLQQQVKDRGCRIEALRTTVTFPMGAYSQRHAGLVALPKGAVIAIPNDPTNGARALRLLESAALLTLPAQAGLNVSVLDVQSTRADFRLRELDAAQLARVLQDVDLAVINTNDALEAGLDPFKALVREPPVSSYANVLVVRAGDGTRADIRVLLEVYQSAEVRAFIEKTFKGAVVPAF